MKITQILGMLIILAASILCCYVYDWKLMLIIIIFLWGNNLEQSKK